MRVAVTALLIIAVILILRQVTAGRASPYITAAKVLQRYQAGDPLVLVDVRERAEFVTGHIPGSRHIPLAQLEERLGELGRHEEIIVICLTGSRSARATRLLIQAGFSAKNMRGGILQWRGPLAK
jgi:rhodanese-related sulfurtransferase